MIVRNSGLFIAALAQDFHLQMKLLWEAVIYKNLPGWYIVDLLEISMMQLIFETMGASHAHVGWICSLHVCVIWLEWENKLKDMS